MQTQSAAKLVKPTNPWVGPKRLTQPRRTNLETVRRTRAQLEQIFTEPSARRRPSAWFDIVLLQDSCIRLPACISRPAALYQPFSGMLSPRPFGSHKKRFKLYKKEDKTSHSIWNWLRKLRQCVCSDWTINELLWSNWQAQRARTVRSHLWMIYKANFNRSTNSC